MKNPLKFSVAAAVALTSVVPNLALGAENDYDIFWSNTKDKIVYTNNLGPETEIEKRFGDKELKAHSGNNVRINLNNSSGLVSFDDYIFGGYRLEALNQPEDASNNTVTLTSGQVQGGIIGGLSAGVENAFACAFNNDCVFTGNANGNTVIINGDATNYATNYAVGGIGLAFANDNSVIINSGIVEKDVIGGMTAQTAAIGNRVYFYGGEVKGDIYGGVGVSIDPSAISTMVGSGFDPSGLTFVKVAGSGQNFTTNNTLYLGSDKTTAIAMNKLKAKNIYNFANIQFVLKGGNINKDDVALTLTDTRKTDLSNSNVEVYFTDVTNLSANYPIHLIKTAGELTAPKSGSIQNADKWVNIANLLNIVGSIGVSTDKKFLDLSFTGNAVVLPKDKIFNIIAQNKYTRKMADETNKDFTLNGSFDEEELTAPDGSVSYAQNVVNVDFTGDSFGHRNIYGGKADGGQLIKLNTVNLKDGIFFGVTDIYGGYALSGNAYSNKINITGGSKSDLGGGIYGGYSFSGDTEENIVNIDGGKFSDVSIYGGLTEKGSSSLNMIEMKSGEVGSLIGGRSASSNVLKNDVYLSGGTVTGDVIGGSGLSGSVIDNNTVTIEGGTVKGDVYGAYHGNWQKDYTVKNNTINYTGGEIQGSIYAHKGANTSSNNTLNIGKNPSNPLTLGRTLKAYNIYNFDNLNFYLPSNIANEAIALKLSDTGETDLSKSTVTAYLSNASNLNANSVVHLIQTAGTLSAPKNNDAEQTNVSLAGLLNVKGYVKLTDSKNLDLYFKTPTQTTTWSSKDTTFNITGPNKFTRIMTDGTNTQNQDFTITDNFDSGELVTIKDATSSDGTGGTVTQSLIDNKVNVDLKTTFIGVIYGGYSSVYTAEVKNNTINVNNGTVNGSVRGGYITANGNDSSSVTGNKVVISGGTVNTVYGGLSDGASLVADNTIDFIGGKVNSFIYGGRSARGTTKNNTLNIGTSTKKVIGLSAGSIADIDNLNFYMLTTLSDGDTALTLNSGNLDLTKTTITVDNLSSYIDGTGNKYYLLKNTGAGTISVNDSLFANNTYGNVFNVIGSTQYNVAKGGIFQSADKKDLYITSTANSTETITGDTFGDDEAGIKDGITVNLANSNYDKLNINIANSATINLTNAHNVGSVISSGSTLDIKGGSTFDTGASIDVKTANFGDSSDAMVMDMYDISALKAKEINFYLPSNVANGETALKVANSVDLSGTKVNAYLKDATGITSKDDKIHLIQTAKSITGFDETNGKANLTNVNIAGLINVIGKIAVDNTAKNLDLTFNGDPSGGGSGGGGTGGATANANSKQLLENSLAGMIAVNETINNLVSNLDNLGSNANSGSTNTDSQANINENSGEAVVFANIIGHDKRYITGSHVDSKGFSLSSGIVGNDYYNSGKLTTGLFVEYGKAKYESVLDNGLVGEGKTEFIGGGAFGKFKFINNFYTEASARIGNIKTKAEKGMYDEYKLSNTYYGAHFGLGKVFDLTSSNELDIYAKYFYSHIAGEEIELRGVNVDLGSVTSSKFKTGFKDSMKFSDTSSLYAGLAYQYEAKGDAKGSLSAFNQSANIASPSLKGSTGIGEIGYAYETNSIKFDIGAKGYVGKEKGYSGNLGVTFKF